MAFGVARAVSTGQWSARESDDDTDGAIAD
jgi:hypothetical protein